MKKLIVLLFIISSNLVFAQNTAVLEINSALTNTQSSARDLIKIKPGSVIKANSGGNSKVFINKAIELPVSTQASNAINATTGFIERDLDKSLEVGTINGMASVSSVGSANYTIPINLPPGTNGLVPSVSVNYNHLQKSRGLLGVGWDLAATSSIYRCSKNLYNDGYNENFDFSISDAFSIDGIRLNSTSTIDNEEIKVYHTEEESYTLIEAHKTNNIIDYFIVKSKDGTTKEYGNTVDSKWYAANNTTPYSYYLSKVIDRNGNYVEYKYDNSNNEIVLKTIKYTGNLNGQLPYNEINFYYDKVNEDRSYLYLHYSINSTKILREIEVKSETIHSLTYKFNYTEIEGKKFLNEVIKYGSGGSEKYNSTLFSYSENTSNVTALTLSESNFIDDLNYLDYIKDYSLFDFNNDGKKDIIVFLGSFITGSIPPYIQSLYNTDPITNSTGFNWLELRVYKNIGNGNFKLNLSASTYDLPQNFLNYYYHNLKKSTPGNSILEMYDVNGDNNEDLLLTTIDPTQSTDGNPNMCIGNLNIYFSDGENGFPSLSTPSTSIPLKLSKNNEGKADVLSASFLMDINADGKLDLFNYYTDVNNNHFISAWLNLPDPTASFTQQTGILDFTNAVQTNIYNDGITSLSNVLDYNGTCTQLYYNHLNNNFNLYGTSNSYSLPRYTKTQTSCALAYDVKFSLFGDFNGDALTDELECINSSGPGTNSAIWKLHYFKTPHNFNQSSNYSKDITSLGLSFPFGLSNKIFFCRDLNADSKTDIVEFITNGYSSIINIYYSTGLDFVKKSFSISTPQNNINICDYQFEFGDLNADGNEDLLINNRKLGEKPVIVYFNYGAKSGLLKQVLNGLNQSTVFEYESIGNDPQMYTSTANDYTYPLALVSPSIVLVKKQFNYLPGGTINENQYSYKNCVMHKRGKGFIGFQYNASYNVLSDIKTESTSEINLTYFKPIPVSSKATHVGLNQLLNENLSSISLIPTGWRKYETRVNSITSTDNIKNRTVIQNFNNYDSYGNVLKKTVTSKGVTNILEIIETNYTYAQFNTWIPASVITCTTKVQSFNAGSLSGEKTTYDTYDYDLVKGNLISTISNSNLPKGIKKEFLLYNDFGLFTKTKTSVLDNSTNPRETLVDYDNKYRFVTKTTNIADGVSYVSSSVIDNRWGVPIFETSTNGFITQYYYNKFGVLTSKVMPDGIIKEFKTEWATGSELSSDNTVNFQEPLYYTEQLETNRASVKTYYNFLGQDLRTETENLVGKIYAAKEYNNKGQLIKEANNYELISPTNATLFNMYSYDDLNRVVETKITDDPLSTTAGIPTNYGYNNFTNGNETVTITNVKAGQVSSKTTNALNELISATDDGGTITYEYNVDRSLKSTKIGTVTTNQIQYDSYGNQSSLTETNSGTTLYVYDGFGQLIKQTDAAGQVYDITYDDLGRIKTKTGPDGIYTYNYLTIGKAIGSLESVNGPNNSIKQYVYDDYARVTKITEGTTAKSFITQMEYDSYGNMITKNYPGNYAVNYEYNSNGILTAIKQKDNGQVLWFANSMLPNGTYNKYTYGNGLLNEKTFDNYGNLIHQKAGNVFDMEYQFDIATGNMLMRKDNIAQLSEDFTYDNLNRLTGILPGLNASYTPGVTAYKPNGNIDNKTDAGTFTYNVTKVNAIETVTNPVPEISLSQQDITYTPFKKASSISEGNLLYTLNYGTNQQRIKSVLVTAGITTYTRYYASNFEQTINNAGLITDVTYIESPSGICAMYVNDNGNKQLFYVHSDHLGSINTLTNTSGTVATYNGNVLKQSFDAWGRRRNYSNWGYANLNSLPQWFSRGYTGHEHLYQFGLINMNGRMYDPILGRMLSPDNFAQAPYFTQSHNRYTYCLNNPLKFVDPDGNFWHIVIGAAVGGLVNLGVKAYQGKIDSWTDGFVAFGIGAAAGAIGAATGGAAFAAAGGAAAGAGGFLAGAAAGAVGTAFSAPIQNIGNMAYFGDPLMSGKEYVTQIAFSGLTGGVTNGLIASYHGRNFWTGDMPRPQFQITQPMPVKEIKYYNRDYHNVDEIDLPDKIYHYTDRNPYEWGGKVGQYPNSDVHYTIDPDLNSVSAPLDLDLPSNQAYYRVEVRTSDPSFDPAKIEVIRRVQGNLFGHGGGGVEIKYNGQVDFDEATITLISIFK
jgi:RHS repeat-associated protein